jgi:hypothetical protein
MRYTPSNRVARVAAGGAEGEHAATSSAGGRAGTLLEPQDRRQRRTRGGVAVEVPIDGGDGATERGDVARHHADATAAAEDPGVVGVVALQRRELGRQQLGGGAGEDAELIRRQPMS